MPVATAGARKREFRACGSRVCRRRAERGIRYADLPTGSCGEHPRQSQVLSEIAIHRPAGFDAVVAVVRQSLGKAA